MIIRFNINNLFSFGKEKEFNMLPSPRYKRLNHHKYSFKNFEFLKLASIYGANGSGKSNLIKAIAALRSTVVDGKINPYFNEVFKLDPNNLKKSTILGIEFIKDELSYLYAIEVKDNIVLTEELYRTGLGKIDDYLIFKRTTDKKTNIIKFIFSDKFETDPESRTLKKVIEKNLIKPNQSSLKILSELDNFFLELLKKPFDWFRSDLQILSPTSKPLGLIVSLGLNDKFKDFVNNVMCSFSTGIRKVDTDTKTIDNFFKNDPEELKKVKKIFSENPKAIIQLKNVKDENITALKEKGKYVVKRIILKHNGANNNLVDFNLSQESDGTNRLLDYIPVLFNLLNTKKVYIIDEIERSLHPLIIKEIINKFSKEKGSLGQLIFTTHESNLLDQNMLRQDEIWFTEKDHFGCTDIYPLSDFKEHHTKDIKKGYFNGRYGAIPFLGNLKDLNWNIDVSNK